MEAGKTEIRKFVAVDPSKCIGCGLCEIICILEKGEPFLSPTRSRIHVIRILPFFNIATACRLCSDAPCVKACPRNALLQKESGVISVDEDKCDLCGWCVMACPYGAIALHSVKPSVLICDLCEGDPKCVEFCPEEALALASQDEAEKLWRASVKQLPTEMENFMALIKARKVHALFEGLEEKTRRFYWKYKEMEKRYKLK
jgi:Fe-S-cluster-containing dehydrogenase component